MIKKYMVVVSGYDCDMYKIDVHPLEFEDGTDSDKINEYCEAIPSNFDTWVLLDEKPEFNFKPVYQVPACELPEDV